MDIGVPSSAWTQPSSPHPLSEARYIECRWRGLASPGCSYAGTRDAFVITVRICGRRDRAECRRVLCNGLRLGRCEHTCVCGVTHAVDTCRFVPAWQNAFLWRKVYGADQPCYNRLFGTLLTAWPPSFRRTSYGIRHCVPNMDWRNRDIAAARVWTARQEVRQGHPQQSWLQSFGFSRGHRPSPAMVPVDSQIPFHQAIRCTAPDGSGHLRQSVPSISLYQTVCPTACGWVSKA